MFGNYSRSLDEKNRVMIPAKHREVLGETFYVTYGPDQILELRDEKSFSVFRDKLLGTNMLNANARKFARLVLGNTIEATTDKQGRIVIPDNFLKLAKLTKEIVFVGVGNKIELWSKEAYDELQNDFSGAGSLDDLAAQLLKDGVEL